MLTGRVLDCRRTAVRWAVWLASLLGGVMAKTTKKNPTNKLPTRQAPVVVLSPDAHNANLGTDRGKELLAESLETCGTGRSILVDRHGKVIAGNKTLEAARAAGLPIQVVDSDGHRLIVVQREDLDLITDKRARQLAYYDNRVQQVDLNWAPNRVQADVLAGVDLSVAFFPEEISEITANATPAEDPFSSVTSKTAPSTHMSDPSSPFPASPMPEIEPEEPSGTAASPPTKIHLTIVFHNLSQQLRWGSFMRILRRRYPDMTQGERLMAYLTEIA